MIKNRITQIIFQSMYIGISFIAILASFGLFDMAFRWDFYIYFTNVSNYLCIIMMLIELINTAKKRINDYVRILPVLKFISLLSILLTFIVYNFVLASTRDIKSSFVVGSITLHVILPLMFVFDYLLFYEHGKIKWYYPIVSTIFPLGYTAFVFIHAFLMEFDTSIMSFDGSSPFIYPYFFFNIDKYGVGGVAKNVLFMSIAFVVFGYALFVFDKLLYTARGK